MKDNLRVWVLGAILASGALLAGGWFVGVQPLLATAQANDQATAQAESQNQTLQVRLLGLQAAQRHIGDLRIAAAQVQAAVPGGLDAQAFVNRLNVLAAEDGVTVVSMTPGTPVAYTQPDAGEGKVEAFTDPRITAANLAVLPMSVQVVGPDAAARAFISHVQHDSRLFLVDGLTIAASPTGTGTSATLSGDVYALSTSGS